MKKLLVSLFLAAAASGPALALDTDRDQPIEVTADRFNGDEVKQTAVYSGNVIVTQGSMRLTGSRLELSVTPKGYRRVAVTGKPAHFKQQRDRKKAHVDEWVHADANSIVYDEETDTVTLQGKAALNRTENGISKDMTSGESIVYDMRNARSQVQGAKGQRVTTIIAPRKSTEKNEPRAGTSLSSSTKLSTSKE